MITVTYACNIQVWNYNSFIKRANFYTELKDKWIMKLHLQTNPENYSRHISSMLLVLRSNWTHGFIFLSCCASIQLMYTLFLVITAIIEQIYDFQYIRHIPLHPAILLFIQMSASTKATILVPTGSVTEQQMGRQNILK